jgi:hypothetical protein
VLAPFRGVRYAENRVTGLAEVTSPPYDVIAADNESQLMAADPHNVVRLILPRHQPGQPGSPYEDAAKELTTWLADGILTPDPDPALYVYEQSAPALGVLQRGLIGALRLAPYSARIVQPHEDVAPGPVKIDGSIYPKSILFYCNVGDATAFPAYKLEHNASRFQATIGLGAKFPPHFEAYVILDGDGHTLRTFTVSALGPETVDVNVTGVHTLQLECFGSGQSSSAGWAISVAWGNARVVERH